MSRITEAGGWRLEVGGRCASALLALAGLAAPAFAEEPPPDDEKTLPEADSAPVAVPVRMGRPPPRAFAGAHVGAAIPLAHLDPSPAAGMEGGIVLRPLGGRLQPLVAFDFASPSASGSVDDPALSYDWNLSVATFTTVLGIRARLLPWSESLSPELAVGPALFGTTAYAHLATATASLPDERESTLGLGVWASAGLVGKLGPGQLEGRVAFSTFSLDGALTGAVSLHTLTPTVGYRIAR